ncbi:MAG TPA: ergothioneine biosynthesis protein EgtB [Caulobacteraceae bacterium]|nr:ergothioneine biosynthesis protein EgtB [Caulobacteraceae bacterium]
MPPLDEAPALLVANARADDEPAEGLAERYLKVRRRSLEVAAPLSPEDQVVQAMEDASPTKWHLAHTTWFFETFLLTPHLGGYALFDPDFGYLFNSYYEAVGPRHPRPLRGLLSRPSHAEVLAYRRAVDTAMTPLLARAERERELGDLVALGLAHEEQHQELMLMDILALFAASPLAPAYDRSASWAKSAMGPSLWVAFAGGAAEIGACGEAFSFDNEGPRHAVALAPYSLASKLVTNGQWLAFMDAGGYDRTEFWHADGWRRVSEEGWRAPAYWREGPDGWRELTLAGLEELDPAAPVAHISWFEASAFAAWTGARLPTEAEWEHAASSRPEAFEQLFGALWQWTASAYAPYPGFRAARGAIGEYNGKFMSGQMTLRGSCLATPEGHARSTYRNFFYPHQRWMFSGLRLARDGAEDEAASFEADVIAGLSAPRKSLPAKWFYDAEGSRLFEAISELPEYYLTRQESALLAGIAPEIGAAIPARAVLAELGSGASLKTRILLDAAPQIAAYVPVDINPGALDAAARTIAADYPDLVVRPLAADFTRAEALPTDVPVGPRVGFFPGSTIGNFAPAETVALLARIRGLLGPGSLLVIGVDLAKDAATLEAAYDDPAGVTAAFNRNVLARINRELDGDFDPEKFAHVAVWNRAQGRIEMHLEALEEQIVRAAGRSFAFVAGETIHTENSYKFTPAGFRDLARRAGWRVERSWMSPPPMFAVLLLAN